MSHDSYFNVEKVNIYLVVVTCALDFSELKEMPGTQS